MNRYGGNSYYLIIRAIFIIASLILIGYIIYALNAPSEVIYELLLLVLLCFVYFVILLKRLLYIVFRDDELIVTYLITKSKEVIPYAKVVEFICIGSRVGSHFNVIKYKSYNFIGTKEVKVDRIVDHEEFISFVKWVKGKNDKIKFKIVPSDSKLLHEFNKEFGLKK